MGVLTDDEIVERVIKYTESSAFDLKMAQDHLRFLLERESWKRFRTPNGQEITYTRFSDFVTAKRPFGIESRPDDVRKIAADDPALTVKVRDALVSHGGDRRSDSFKDNNIIRTPQGTAADYTLGRLSRESPELFAAVERGDLTAHAAAIKAGFRVPTVTIRVEPASAARTIRRKFTPEQVAQLARLLND